MGWKSTLDITRDEAVKAIQEEMFKLNNKTNIELESMLIELGFGDDTDKKWYGYNFYITDE